MKYFFLHVESIQRAFSLQGESITVSAKSLTMGTLKDGLEKSTDQKTYIIVGF